MTYEELQIRLQSPISLSDEDFSEIQVVYQHHPLIKTKDDIAKMVDIGGMIIIHDMLPRAIAIREAEREYQRAQRTLDAAREKYEALRTA